MTNTVESENRVRTRWRRSEEHKKKEMLKGKVALISCRRRLFVWEKHEVLVSPQQEGSRFGKSSLDTGNAQHATNMLDLLIQTVSVHKSIAWRREKT